MRAEHLPAGPASSKSLSFAEDENLVLNSLFPAGQYRRQVDDRLTGLLATAQTGIAQNAVSPRMDFAEALESLAVWQFDSPHDIEAVLAWIVSRMSQGIVQIGHPKYFGLFNPTPSFPAQCADRIVSLFNPQLATAVTSPFPVAVEAHVIKAFTARAGLPPHAGGHFTTSGSEANFTAIICALTRIAPAYGDQGIAGLARPPVFYISEDAHLAWVKIAHQAGIGRNNVHLVKTDDFGRLCARHLRQQIRADLEGGFLPFLVAATAGTTGAGMVDPLEEIAEIADEFGIWYHVDAAWGGALLCSDRLRAALAGIEKADSVTIDAHKWLASTMGCGMILVADPVILNQCFHVAMDCMPSNAPSIDPYVSTVQWSRRFLGLRLFTALATAGWSGYSRHIEKAIQTAEHICSALTESGWKRLNDSEMAVLCMRPPEGASSPAVIARAVVESGEAWISVVEFQGQSVLRICATSGETTDEDVSDLVASIRRNTFLPGHSS